MKQSNPNDINNNENNQIISILLIGVIVLLSRYFTNREFETFFDSLLISIPVFTILLTGYVFFYGLKKNTWKIAYVILIIFSILFLSVYYWASNFMKGN